LGVDEAQNPSCLVLL